jgi:hypothetical protein
MLDKKEGGAALTGLSNVIQQRTWSKNERVNKRANKTQTANQMEHSRAKVCAQEKASRIKHCRYFRCFLASPLKPPAALRHTAQNLKPQTRQFARLGNSKAVHRGIRFQNIRFAGCVFKQLFKNKKA